MDGGSSLYSKIELLSGIVIYLSNASLCRHFANCDRSPTQPEFVGRAYGNFTLKDWHDARVTFLSFSAGIMTCKISYSFWGPMVRIGNMPVSHGFWGRILAIGHIEIRYGTFGRIIQIGDMSVSYGFWGRITSIGDMDIYYSTFGRAVEISSRLVSAPIDDSLGHKQIAVLVALLARAQESNQYTSAIAV